MFALFMLNHVGAQLTEAAIADGRLEYPKLSPKLMRSLNLTEVKIQRICWEAAIGAKIPEMAKSVGMDPGRLKALLDAGERDIRKGDYSTQQAGFAQAINICRGVYKSTMKTSLLLQASRAPSVMMRLLEIDNKQYFNTDRSADPDLLEGDDMGASIEGEMEDIFPEFSNIAASEDDPGFERTTDAESAEEWDDDVAFKTR